MARGIDDHDQRVSETSGVRGGRVMADYVRRVRMVMMMMLVDSSNWGMCESPGLGWFQRACEMERKINGYYNYNLDSFVRTGSKLSYAQTFISPFIYPSKLSDSFATETPPQSASVLRQNPTLFIPTPAQTSNTRIISALATCVRGFCVCFVYHYYRVPRDNRGTLFIIPARPIISRSTANNVPRTSVHSATRHEHDDDATTFVNEKKAATAAAAARTTTTTTMCWTTTRLRLLLAVVAVVVQCSSAIDDLRAEWVIKLGVHDVS